MDSISSFNYSSQADRTIRNYSNNGNQRGSNEGGVGNSNQQFEIHNVKKYPRHPRPPHRGSDFELGFSACYHCGKEDHRFLSCPSRHENGARQHMFFNMHCHRPNTYRPEENRSKLQHARNDSYRNTKTYNDSTSEDKRVRFEDSKLNRQAGRGQDNRPAWISHSNHSQYGNRMNLLVNCFEVNITPLMCFRRGRSNLI